ncbi:MAG: hypothetical protein RBT41_08515 [Clostridia bacterium]|jgi:hypothetical protein|nr:hypothetical protein [Clostridia bacterium]
MKKAIKIVIIISAVILIGLWATLKIPFAADINQTITAHIYKDGNAVQETAVYMNGTKSNYLFADEQRFIGKFYIEYHERTGRESMHASVIFRKHGDWQGIIYYQNATFPSLGINYALLINKEMNEFALGFEDGTIIATSDEMYQKYFENS